MQQLASYDCPPPSSPNLKLVMQGIKAYLAKPVRQAAPVTLEMLEKITLLVDFNNSFQLSAYAALLTGFYLILRSSYSVPISTPNFDPMEQFTRWHVGIDQDDKLAMFLIQWSKMIQHCRKELWVPVMPADKRKVCLIATLKEYFQQVPAKPSDPMFCYRNKCKQLKVLMYEQLAEQFKTWVKEIGMDDGKHTLHGLRCGGMTHTF